jgi:outer membrane protein OmpA-like peptidoglycan-associated protein
MGSQRALLIALVLLALVACVGAFLGIRHIQGLESRIAGLDESLTESEQRGAAAAARALQAEEAAQSAAREAVESRRRATREERARIAADDARRVAETDAEIARLEAEYAAEEAAAAQAEADRLRQERDREVTRLQEALGAIADTQRTALGLVMNLGADTINFEFDKADLKPADRELLARIAGVLLTAKGFRIQVFGHTDDVGSAPYNQGLSERRAAAVSDYLVGAGIAAEIITTKGFGKDKPLVAGTSEGARARNRRVEIGIIDTVVQYTTTPEQDEQRPR